MHGDKEVAAHFTSKASEYSRVTCIKRKLRLYVLMRIEFTRIELVVKLAFEVKTAVHTVQCRATTFYTTSWVS